jgi:hypothetical protein
MIDRRGAAVSITKLITSATGRKTVQAKAITPTSCHGFRAIAPIEFLRTTAKGNVRSSRSYYTALG